MLVHYRKILQAAMASRQIITQLRLMLYYLLLPVEAFVTRIK